MNTLSFNEAVKILKNNGVIIYPTETFYAIGGSALSLEVVKSVYKCKRRDKTLPLPVIIGDLSQLDLVAAVHCPEAEMLMGTFWPGPLTIILPARPELPGLLTAESGRVAVRLSSHYEACNLAIEAGVPLVSSSANISGRPAVSDIAKLDPELIASVNAAVYSGGKDPMGGTASTIVELIKSDNGEKILHILREGAIPASSFSALGFKWQIE